MLRQPSLGYLQGRGNQTLFINLLDNLQKRFHSQGGLVLDWGGDVAGAS